jgi:hypothetical protein
MRRGLGLACVVGLLALGLPACGGPSDSERFSMTTPGADEPVVRVLEGSAKPRRGKPTHQEVSVIRGWANALRAGHVNRAAAFFALPALIADGVRPKRRVADKAAIRAFNRGLPCGAKLLNTKRGADSFVVATFRLTERPGPRPGACGAGTDQRAAVVFLVENHHIVQWLRADDPAQPAPGNHS